MAYCRRCEVKGGIIPPCPIPSRMTAYNTVLLVVSGLNLFENNKKITVSPPEWSCDIENKLWDCKVSFTLKNLSHKDTISKWSIRGFAMKKADRQSKNVLGERKTLSVNLSGYAEKSFHETIKSKRKPTKISITLLEYEVVK